ncbi:hypothetical protein WMW71_12965 [Flavobacterium buctense]|uniref:Lipoprotein n=1 Tax=Flavobacterium buctense TaxID=1648146 RepID=A0ABU9E3U7_9FLAO|nr:hypothetical protein [Flavobacterium buctense]
MKRNLVLILINVLLVSCSASKPNIIDYHSEKLCGGIKNMSEYIKNSNEIKAFFLKNPSDSTILKSEIDSLVTEGIVFPFLQSEVANIIKNEEKISLDQAYSRLEVKFLSKPIIKLNSVCVKQTNVSSPEVKIEYYYYPEYALLTAQISKIKYSQEYGKGYLVLAKIDSNGEMKILKSSFWEE